MVIALLAAAGLVCWPTRRRTRLPRIPADGSGGVRVWTPGPHGWSGVVTRVRPWVLAAVGGGCLLPAGPAPATAAAVAVGTVAALLRRAVADRRGSRERADLVAALGMVARDLRAGAAPSRALRAAAGTSRGATRAVLERVAANPTGPTGPGAPETGSVAQVVGDRLAACWTVSHRHGLPLARLVEALRADLHAEVQRAEARGSEAAGPRLSGHLLAALPVLGLLLGAGMGADPVGVLTGTMPGRVLLIVGVLLTCAGLLWTDRLVAGPDRR